MLKKLKDYFRPLKVISYIYVEDLTSAEQAGCHAAIWGNGEIHSPSFGGMSLGAREVMGIRVNRPELVHECNSSTKRKIVEHLHREMFVWSGDLVVFPENIFRGLFTDGDRQARSFNLGSYVEAACSDR